MTLEERARDERRLNGAWTNQHVAAFARQVAREERERCAKVMCKRCNDSTPIPFEPHYPWVHRVGMDNFKCDAAAIRSLEEEP
jgi:hypothetical protein